MAKKPTEKDVTLAEGTFKRKKALVAPILSTKDLKAGESVFVEFESEPVTRAQTTAGGKPKIDPDTGAEMTITSAMVIDLNTGALGEIVLGFIVCKALAPLGSLVGRRFEFVKGEKKGRTTMWSVYELEAD